MTIEARIGLALEELDELLGIGTAVEDALNAAALSQTVQPHVLLARATRTLSIDERQSLCLAKAKQKAAIRASSQRTASFNRKPKQLKLDF